MLHNRLDYQNIQDPDGRFAPDEPVFILRARCPIAAKTVQRWCDLADEAGFNADYVASGRRWAEVMQAWNHERGRSTPAVDLPPMRV